MSHRPPRSLGLVRCPTVHPEPAKSSASMTPTLISAQNAHGDGKKKSLKHPTFPTSTHFPLWALKREQGGYTHSNRNEKILYKGKKKLKERKRAHIQGWNSLISHPMGKASKVKLVLRNSSAFFSPGIMTLLQSGSFFNVFDDVFRISNNFSFLRSYVLN